MSRRSCLLGLACWLLSCGHPPPAPPPPGSSLLHYRLERFEPRVGRWEVAASKGTFRVDQEVRFRFTSNVGGVLYVLNGSDGANLSPVFRLQGARGLPEALGAGTHIDANRVGLWPPPGQGSAIRFSDHEGMERFLFVFVPDDLRPTREVQAVVPGAEGWDLDAPTTRTASAPQGDLLVHSLELRSR